MSGYLSRSALMDYMPTRNMHPSDAAEAREHRRNQLHRGYLMSTPQPEVADMLADEYAADDERREKGFRRLRESAKPTGGALGYIDDLMRTMGDRASFGMADHLEGLLNSYLYDADVNDSLGMSDARTRRARGELGDYVGAGADMLGTLGGYATLLPRLPLALAGRGLLTPAAIPLEGARGYFDTMGDVPTRLQGGVQNLADNPMSILNPTTGRGLAGNMFFEPLMHGAGIGDLTPSAYFNRLVGE